MANRPSSSFPKRIECDGNNYLKTDTPIVKCCFSFGRAALRDTSTGTAQSLALLLNLSHLSPLKRPLLCLNVGVDFMQKKFATTKHVP